MAAPESTLLALGIGIALSAACGFRIMIPLVAISLGARAGELHLASDFSWMASDLALGIFLIGMVCEICAYYIPAVDNFLDTIASPAALIAGTIITASMIQDMSPMLRWTLAVIAGGGAAGLVQAKTVVVRALSTLTTGGLGNPIVASGELAGAATVSALAIFVPGLAIFGAVCLLVATGFALRWAWKKLRSSRNAAQVADNTQDTRVT